MDDLFSSVWLDNSCLFWWKSTGSYCICAVCYPLLTHSKEINKGDGLLFAFTEHEINVFFQVNLLFYLPGPICLISLILLFATSQTGHYVFVCLCLCQCVCFVRSNLDRGNGPFHLDICFREWKLRCWCKTCCWWVEVFSVIGSVLLKEKFTKDWTFCRLLTCFSFMQLYFWKYFVTKGCPKKPH